MVYFFAGSEVASSSWEECRRELAAQGVAGTAVSYDLSDWAQGYNEAISRLAAKVTPGSILVGHSLAGLFLPVLGERIGASAEIYVAALTPEPRISFTEQVFESRLEIFTSGWTRNYGVTTREAQDTVQELLFGDCPAGSARFKKKRRTFPSYTISPARYPSCLPASATISPAATIGRLLRNGSTTPPSDGSEWNPSIWMRATSPNFPPRDSLRAPLRTSLPPR